MTGYTTRHQLPYPQGSDPVRDAENTAQQLAERLDELLTDRVQTAAGFLNLPVAATNTNYSARILFPAGRFTATPAVIAQAQVTVSSMGTVEVVASSVDADGFTLNWRRSAGGDFTCAWQAISTSTQT